MYQIGVYMRLSEGRTALVCRAREFVLLIVFRVRLIV